MPYWFYPPIVEGSGKSGDPGKIAALLGSLEGPVSRRRLIVILPDGSRRLARLESQADGSVKLMTDEDPCRAICCGPCWIKLVQCPPFPDPDCQGAGVQDEIWTSCDAICESDGQIITPGTTVRIDGFCYLVTNETAPVPGPRVWDPSFPLQCVSRNPECDNPVLCPGGPYRRAVPCDNGPGELYICNPVGCSVVRLAGSGLNQNDNRCFRIDAASPPLYRFQIPDGAEIIFDFLGTDRIEARYNDCCACQCNRYHVTDCDANPIVDCCCDYQNPQDLIVRLEYALVTIFDRDTGLFRSWEQEGTVDINVQSFADVPYTYTENGNATTGLRSVSNVDFLCGNSPSSRGSFCPAIVTNSVGLYVEFARVNCLLYDNPDLIISGPGIVEQNCTTFAWELTVDDSVIVGPTSLGTIVTNRFRYRIINPNAAIPTVGCEGGCDTQQIGTLLLDVRKFFR